LHWEALRRNDRPYYFSAVLVGPDGRALPGVVWQPLATRYPTTCWSPGQSVIDRIELPLGNEPPPGEWWLSLSAFGMAGEQPTANLPVTLPGGARDTQVGLGPLRVDAP
jgi:hypothetical protein